MGIFNRKYLIFVTLGISFALVAVFLYFLDSQFKYKELVFVFWILGIFFSLVPFLPQILQKLKIIKLPRKELLFISLLVLVSILLRFYKLQQIPFLNGDEARDAGFLPESFLNGQINDYFGYNVYGISNIFIILAAIPHLIFGHSILSVRFFAAVFGTLSVLLVYLLGRKFYSLKVGIIASTMMAFNQVHLQFSRSEFINNFDSFWAPLVILFLLYALAKKETFFSLLFGLSIGLATHFYQGIRAVLLFSIVSFIFYNLTSFRKNNKSIKKIIYFIFGFFVAFGPSLVVLIFKPNEFFNTGSSGNYLSIITSHAGSLFEGLLTFIGNLPNRFLLSYGSIIYYPIDFHYRYGGPLLKFPESALFLAGMIIVLKKILSFKYFVLLGWIVIVVFINSILTESMNFAHRLLSLLPSTIIVAAIGLEGLVLFFKKKKPGVVVLIFILTLSVFLNFKQYFIDNIWRNAYDTNTKVALAAGYYTSSFSLEKQIYFLNSPRMGWKSGPSWEYLVPNSQVKDLSNKELSILLEKTANFNNVVFVALPERAEDLKIVIKRWPGGVRNDHTFYSPEVLFTSYELK